MDAVGATTIRQLALDHQEVDLVRRKVPEGVEFLNDTSAAGWIEERLWAWRNG